MKKRTQCETKPINMIKQKIDLDYSLGFVRKVVRKLNLSLSNRVQGKTEDIVYFLIQDFYKESN